MSEINSNNGNDIYYCSNCGTEISKEEIKCQNCGAELGDSEENVDNESTVVVKTFMNEFEAEIAKSVLEEEGIESFISKDDEGSMNPALQLTMGVKLHVFEKDEEKALEILNSLNT
jgi:hypothetical protein